MSYQTLARQYYQGGGQIYFGFNNPIFTGGIFWDGSAPIDNLTTTGKACYSIHTTLNLSRHTEAIYTNFFNFDTASGVWLDIIGRWVGVDRWLYVPSEEIPFGFGDDFENFDNGTFFDSTNTADNYQATDQVFKKMILAKAAANISGCSVPDINNVLRIVFDNRPVYVIDNQDMTIRINFEFTPQEWERSIMLYADLIPRPAGVLLTFSNYTDDNFGFADDFQNFDNGTFYNDF